MLSLELIIIGLALVVASFTDFRSREVPDWLNYSLIATGFGIGIIKSIVSYSILPISYSIAGFAAAFLISALMFYTGQWGGGDAKMLMGIGAIIGVSKNIESFFVSFMVNLIISGAIYGIIWGIIISVQNRKKVFREFINILNKKNVAKLKRTLFLFLAIIVLIIVISPLKDLKLSFISLILLIYLTFYLWIYVKAIENTSMTKKIEPSKLTEGDWIVEDVIIKSKVIASKKDLGVSKEQIEKLKKLKVKNVTVKEGIPFIPSFLISYIITLIYGNILIILIYKGI